MSEAKITVVVKEILDCARAIKSFEFRRADGGELPPFSAGAHVDVEVPGGLLRQYSLCNDPSERQRYVVAVLRETDGRGGSQAMHDDLGVGETLSISAPRNNFPLAEDAERHLLIAGGVGVTPMMAMVRQLAGEGAAYDMHYCAKTADDTAFADELTAAPFAGHVHFHHDGGDPSKGLDVTALLRQVTTGTHLYCCGPTGLMDAVKQACAHWPAAKVHFEHFTADQDALAAPSDSFEVEIASTGDVFVVPADKSILEVLEDNGFDIDTSCEEGICGTCATPLLEGEADHRDMVLSDQEKAANSFITVCCSRAISARLKLDL